jgi:hypothetical protein
MLVSDDVIQEIHKFPFPIQKLLGDEALAVNGRLEQGKAPPNLITAECNCHFFVRYLLPCRHIFHQHMLGQTKLLTVSTWHSFQLMFEESGFEMYAHREYVEIPKVKPTQAEKDVEHLRVRVEELNERLRDKYFSMLERKSVEESTQFVSCLEETLEPLLKMN